MQGEKPVYGDTVDTTGCICGYLIDLDEEKENHKDATLILRVRQVAKGMEDGASRGQQGGRGVAAAEMGPIQLYHPWEAHVISVQTIKRSESPVPQGFEPNIGPAYIPFHIINGDGHPMPAKCVKVKMTNDPYMYGMLNSTGKVFKGLIHTTPVLDITHVPCITVEDLVSLCFDYPDVSRINNTLARVGD